MKGKADLSLCDAQVFLLWCEGGWEERFGLHWQPGLRDTGPIRTGLLAFHR